MAFRILNILMMKFLYILFSFLFLSNSYANGDQLIPNGNYEFIWKHTDRNKTEKVRTDYAEIVDGKINFISMPCSRALRATATKNFKYKFSDDLSKFNVSGAISVWGDQWRNTKEKFRLKFDKKSIIRDDSKFYELKKKFKYVSEKEFISLTIASTAKEAPDTFKCLFERVDYISATPRSAHEMIEGLDKIKKKKTKVFGRLLLPENLDKKVPVMIMSHPSMGFVPSDWFKWFYDLGIGVFDTQHYTSRGGEAQWFYDLASEEAGNS